MVIVATYGLLITENAGASWSWVCAEALFGEYSVVGPGMLDAEGTITLGSPKGVMRGENLGCDWSRPSDQLERLYISDLHAARSAPAFAVALSWVDDGLSNVFVTRDTGRTWNKEWPPFSARFLTQGVRAWQSATESSTSRIYASGVTLAGTRPYLYRFNSESDAWTEIALAGDDDIAEFAVLVLGVGPANPDRVYLRSISALYDRITVTDDGGMTFRELARLNAPALAAGRPFGFTYTEGGQVWAGNKVAGLWRLDGSEPRRLREDLTVTHLDARGDDLYIGLDGFAGDEMPELMRAPMGDTEALEGVMTYEDVHGVRTCTAPEVQAACEPLWDDLQRHIGLLPPLDAGAGSPDGGTSMSVMDAGVSSPDSGDSSPPPTSTNAGCQIQTHAIASSLAPAIAICFLALLLHRRRRSRSHH
jgi:hypothetical protein